MFCKFCGKQLNPTDKFCCHCGTPVGPGLTNQAPAANTNNAPDKKTASQPAGTKPGFKLPNIQLPNIQLPGGKLIPVAAIALVVILVVALLVTGSPSAKVAKAFGNTIGEFSDVSDLWHAEDVAALLQKDALSMTMDVSPEETMLEGFGIRGRVDVSLPKKYMGVNVVPYIGSMDLVNASMVLDDETLAISIPEVLPKNYGLNTETLLQDLQNMGADVEGFEDVTVNFFDTLKSIREQTDNSKENQKLLKAAAADFVDALEVEKSGSKSITVNKSKTKCTVYTVTIPQDAMEDYVAIIEEILSSVDYADIVESELDRMGMPSFVTREVLNEVKDAYTTPDLSDIYTVIDTLGDVELDVYVSKNKISAIKYEENRSDFNLEIELLIGGGDNYVDDITLKMANMSGDEIVVKSKGNHTGKGGVFTDKTTIEVDGDVLTIEVEYEPKAKEDNLSISMESDYPSDTFKLEGNYTASKGSMKLNLKELTMGRTTVKTNMDLGISDYSKKVTVSKPVILNNMTEEEIMQIMEEVEEQATTWLESIVEEYPELQYMF